MTSLGVISLGPRKAAVGPYRLTRVDTRTHRYRWEIRHDGRLIATARTLNEVREWISGRPPTGRDTNE